MILPSKELLSAVLGKKITTVDLEDNNIVYHTSWINIHHLGKTSINIYELMHWMKEWADTNNYWIDSNINFVSIGEKGNMSVCKTFNGYDLRLKEYELVTKACEWILKEYNNEKVNRR